MSSTTERKLAAIMFTDIAGYTAQMSKDEARAMELLKEKESILKPLLKEYKGTFVKEIGDGTLSYFESAVNAATCAVKLQETTYDDKDMNIRVGIHIGDIVFKDGDVFNFILGNVTYIDFVKDIVCSCAADNTPCKYLICKHGTHYGVFTFVYI